MKDVTMTKEQLVGSMKAHYQRVNSSAVISKHAWHL